jgi:hypothetical protein
MKKIILPALLGVVLFSSCRKDYTCECVNKSVASNGESSMYTNTTNYKDVKKSFVTDKAECYSTEYDYTTEQFTGIDPITFEPIYENIKVTVTSDCSIK